MKLDKPTIIGFKYVGAGLIGFIISLLIINKLIGYDNTCAMGAGIGIMSAMVIVAAREAYHRGR
jgi:hypothetical protein